MTVSRVGHSGFNLDATATVIPAGVEAKDVILLVAYGKGATDTGVTKPADYALLAEYYGNGVIGSGNCLGFAYKVADGSESGSNPTMLLGALAPRGILAVVYRGMDTANPFGTPQSHGGFTVNEQIPDYTTEQENASLFMVHVADDDNAVYSVPTPDYGYTLISQDKSTTGSDAMVQAYDALPYDPANTEAPATLSQPLMVSGGTFDRGSVVFTLNAASGLAQRIGGTGAIRRSPRVVRSA